MPYSSMNISASSCGSCEISISSLPIKSTTGMGCSGSTSGMACPSPRFSRIIIGFLVSNPKPERSLFSSSVNSTSRNGRSSERISCNFSKRVVCRALTTLSVPPRWLSPESFSSLRSTAMRSFSSNSPFIAEMSRDGDTLPVTCATFSSSKQRTT